MDRRRRDVIEFRVQPSAPWFEASIGIRINGENLLDLMRAAEVPFPASACVNASSLFI